MYSEFKTIRDRCLEEHKSKELWPHYYERRFQEFLTFYDFLPHKKNLKVLELGCGIGYCTAFLSKISDEVIATDLETIDPTTHSPGLEITRNFLKSLDISNVTVMHASAEDLPFENNTFDLVFSSHVIEHVPDMEKAIKEINRVLKPGGINFCVVPTTMDRIYAFFILYIYLFQRTTVKIYRKIFKKNTITNSAHILPVNDTQSNVNYYLKHLPFPPPHGVLPSYLKEVKNWTLGNWRSKITQNNQIELQAQYGLQSNALLPLLGNTFPAVGIKIHSITRKLENKIGKIIILKHFGISTLLITKKNKMHSIYKNTLFLESRSFTLARLWHQ
ncbi:MAG: class I SAM-dependent methyltransferase [Bacteroidetes bacterium]|nr:class I SAM-dependent methyltransferase [Bacteroidota bacterium]